MPSCLLMVRQREATVLPPATAAPRAPPLPPPPALAPPLSVVQAQQVEKAVLLFILMCFGLSCSTVCVYLCQASQPRRFGSACTKLMHSHSCTVSHVSTVMHLFMHIYSMYQQWFKMVMGCTFLHADISSAPIISRSFTIMHVH